MTGITLFHLTVGTILVAVLLHTVVNHLVFPRLKRTPIALRFPRVSVLIPARNEAERIGPSVEGWMAQDYPNYEVVVCDDGSTDGTAERAAAAGRGRPGLRIIEGEPLPPDWRGKPWACHQLRRRADGEVLVFADADVIPAPDALSRAIGALTAWSLDAASAVPTHESPSAHVAALVGVQNWAALALVPSWLALTPRRRLFSAITGHFLVIRTSVYDAIDGFAAVRLDLGEDVALGRRLVALGYRVRLLDGAGVLTCRSYRTLGQAWDAARRNLLPVLFDSPPFLLMALGSLATLYLGPVVVLAVGLALERGGAAWRWIPLGEVALGILTRVIADVRAGHAPWPALLQPLVAGVFLGIGVDSIVRFRVLRVVEWRGRRYDLARPLAKRKR